MNTFTLSFTEESAQLFGYRVGSKIGPFVINKIIREYYIPKPPNKAECPECCAVVKMLNTDKIKVIEFECIKVYF